jgi:hypothetical protein
LVFKVTRIGVMLEMIASGGTPQGARFENQF